MIEKLGKMMGGKRMADRYHDMLSNIQKDALGGLSSNLLHEDLIDKIPDLPFKIPEFEVAGMKINLNDKEQIKSNIKLGKDLLESDMTKNLLKSIPGLEGLGKLFG